MSSHQVDGINNVSVDWAMRLRPVKRETAQLRNKKGARKSRRAVITRPRKLLVNAVQGLRRNIAVT